MSTYSPGNPFAPRQDADAGAAVQPEQTVERATASVEVLLQRVRTAVGELTVLYREADTLDEAVDVLRALKAAQDSPYDAFTAGRADLWETYGEGKHDTESGRTFSFSKPSGSRSCNYAELEAKYPDAYADCVTKKGPKADAVGSLRLPLGDVK